MKEVHELLSIIYSKGTHDEALEPLARLERLLDTLEHPVDHVVLRKTRKICVKFGYSLYGHLPKLYIKFLKVVNRKNTELLIALCNDALLIRDTLTGTETSDLLTSGVRESLVYLLQHGSLDSQQSSVVQSLLETKQSSSFEEELQYAIEELESDSSVGLHIMIDLFSTFPSIKDQLYYFSTQIPAFIKALQPKRSVEIYNLTIRFLDILLPANRFLIKLDEDTTEYQLSYLKLFSQYEDVFYTSCELLKILSKSDKFIHENCVKILYKLWNLYPALRSQLQDLVLGNFKAISSSSSFEPKRKAAEFLYLIMHDREVPGDFKGALESEGLEGLFEDECYDKAQMAAVELKELKINSGFPICAEIKPGEKTAYYVEVTQPSSVLSWGFATEDYDISYTISRMNTHEEVLFKGERIACDTSPVISALLVDSPGLYKFEWNNSFSWFRSKRIRFRISVLCPVKASDDGLIVPKIRIVNPDDVGDLCYVLPNTEFCEVGVAIGSESFEYFNQGLDKSSLDGENPEDKVNRLLATVAGKCKKVGVVEDRIRNRSFDLGLGCFAFCRDVDAFALLNYDSLQVHTLIAVVELDGVRSAVVNSGRLLPNADVSNLKGLDSAAAVATLLGLYGPGTVVVYGVEIEKLVARARLLVPVNIWNNSQVVFSDYSLAECASRLHYLLYRYKSIV